MKTLKSLIEKDGERLAPLLYLLICVVAFGLFIPWLGFYWDDWPTIFYTHSQRISQLINHFSYDRPLSLWAYLLIGRLGTAPIIWHIAALMIRWGIVVAMAWSLKPLWLKQAQRILFIGLIFAIYPGYYLQPSAVIFAPHLAALGLFFVSLGAMGRAASEKDPNWGYWVLSIASSIIQMFTVEYYVGLELIRPIYLWMLLSNHRDKSRNRAARVLRLWWPFILVFVSWAIWRLFLLQLPSEPYPLIFLTDFRINPILAILGLAQTIAKDLIYTLILVWSELVQPSLFDLGDRVNLFAWLVAITTGLALHYLLLQFVKIKNSDSSEKEYSLQGIALGVSALVLGMLPIWMIGETIVQGDYNLRYVLIAMFGAAVTVVSLLLLMVPNPRHRVILISLLVGLAVGNHVRAANEYRLDWELQRSFYWQLFWRAPALEQNTALISFDRLTTYMGDPMTGNALNTLYPQRSRPPVVDLWNFELTRTQTINKILAGEQLDNEYRGLTFSTENSEDLLFFYYMPDTCLWVLSALDVENDYLPAENRELVKFSKAQNILTQPIAGNYPDPNVFGEEPAHMWCFYFQKAELARQQSDWQTIIDLMQEAQQQDYSPNNGIEWLPLVEAYARTENWQPATELSLDIHEMHTKNDRLLCATWMSILQTAVNAETATQAFVAVEQAASCSELLED